MPIVRSLKREFMTALRRFSNYFSAAFEVAREARWSQPPKLIDLVRGGRRDILCDQPDVVYSVGFINIRPAWSYNIRIPASDAVYTVVTITGRGGQSCWDHLHDPQDGGREMLLRTVSGPADESSVDTSFLSGFCHLLIRQYFADDVDRDRYEERRPTLSLNGQSSQPNSRRPEALAPLIVGARFLAPRFYSLSKARLLGPLHVLHEFTTQMPRPSKSQYVDTGRYLVTRFRLDDSLLKIDYDPKGAPWFSFSASSFYLENVGHVNSARLQPNADSSYTILMGRDRLKRQNYFDTGGVDHGLIFFREIRPAANPDFPRCRLAPA